MLSEELVLVACTNGSVIKQRAIWDSEADWKGPRLKKKHASFGTTSTRLSLPSSTPVPGTVLQLQLVPVGANPCSDSG